MKKIKEKTVSVIENGEEILSIHENKIEISLQDILLGVFSLVLLLGYFACMTLALV